MAEVDLSLRAAASVLAFGCIEICCVGPVARDLEDSVDAVIELDGLLHVATTSFIDSNEAADYLSTAPEEECRALTWWLWSASTLSSENPFSP